QTMAETKGSSHTFALWTPKAIICVSNTQGGKVICVGKTPRVCLKIRHTQTHTHTRTHPHTHMHTQTLTRTHVRISPFWSGPFFRLSSYQYIFNVALVCQ